MHPHMKNLTTHILVEPYLQEWAYHRFGHPVKLPRTSAENLLLTRILQKPPTTTEKTPSHQGREGRRLVPLHIRIPDNPLHRPEYYNHLSRRSAARLRHSLEDLFRLHLWSSCRHLVHSRGRLLRGLDEWCRAQGIHLDHREGVRQKFYRMRRSYEASGIIIGRKNQCHESGQK